MSDSGGKREITEKDLNVAIRQEMVEFLREHQPEIIRRAQERLKKTIKEEQKREEKL